MTDTGKETYHHGDLRQAILEAACEHLRTENVDSLSLRALARQIGVSQTAPYRHFDSKNVLFAAVATWGFEILQKDLAAVTLGEATDALQCSEELCLAYLKFSEGHSEKYQLLFNSSLVDFDEYPALQEAGARGFEVLFEVIRRGKQEGFFLNEPESELAATVWSGLHGIASLLQMGRSSEQFQQSSVGSAVEFLDKQRRQAVQRLLQAIRRSKLNTGV